MNEKRFKLDESVYDEVFLRRIIYDDMFGKEYDCSLKCQEELCDLLNNLYEEVLLLKNLKNRM